MTAAEAGFAPSRAPVPFKPFHKWDRNFFAVIVALIWIGVAGGFGVDTFQHFSHGEPAYPLIVHVHAVTYVSWLVLLAVQVTLIRNGRQDIHRKLGMLAIGLALFMIVIGPVTAIAVDRIEFATQGINPSFLAVQFCSVAAFAGLIAAAIARRGDASAHKRLILLATLAISSAGFARLTGPYVVAAMGRTMLGFYIAIFITSDILALAMAGYDVLTRRRLHPAFVVGLAWTGLWQVTALTLYFSPWWRTITTGWVSP